LPLPLPLPLPHEFPNAQPGAGPILVISLQKQSLTPNITPVKPHPD